MKENELREIVATLKVGDRVELEDIDGEQSIGEFDHLDEYGFWMNDEDEGSIFFECDELRKIETNPRTIREVRSGDVITNGKWFRKVFQVLGDGDLLVVFTSCLASDLNDADALSAYSSGATIQELIEGGYELHHPKEETQPRKVTMAEVCEEFGEEVVITDYNPSDDED